MKKSSIIMIEKVSVMTRRIEERSKRENTDVKLGLVKWKIIADDTATRSNFDQNEFSQIIHGVKRCIELVSSGLRR